VGSIRKLAGRGAGTRVLDDSDGGGGIDAEWESLGVGAKEDKRGVEVFREEGDGLCIEILNHGNPPRCQ